MEVWKQDDILKLWPQAARELKGFQGILEPKAGLTAAQLSMAIQLAEVEFQRLTKTESAKAGDGLAHFVLCSCGQHGRIVFPDGRTGGEIASKSNALTYMHYSALVHNNQKENIFSKDELNKILKEMETSALPDEVESGYFTLQINTWNSAKLSQPTLDPADFHKVMDALWNYREFEA